MKAIYVLIISLLFIYSATFSQGLGINSTGNPPHAAAMLDAASTQKGFLPPRMTTAQRDSINNPADGLVVFNLTTESLNYFFGGAWYESKGKIAYPPGSVHCSSGPTVVKEVINPATGRTWMDRNLGATRAATNMDDAQAHGDLYQWGRRTDGHQCRNSASTSTLSSMDQPPHGDFITNGGGYNDWRDPQNDALWQGANGINNPCPSGFRVPTMAEYDAERATWSSNNAFGAFGSPLKFTMAGYRAENADLRNVNAAAYYWANSSNIYANYLVFDGSFAQTSETYRVFGFSVRCIKELVPVPGMIQTLDCNNATHSGNLTQNESASAVNSSIPYTGGNGGNYPEQVVASTGVSGLTATLSAGTFANGAGTILFVISGTPSGSGTASFAVNIGGESCTFTRTVIASAPTYPAGTVHCTPTPTAIVNVLNPTTGKTWMDRNLGASRVATSNTDAESYGDLYQWGRRADGHQCRNSLTTDVLSTSDQPAHGLFIQTGSFPDDWRSPQNNLLWQGVNGQNNPCPHGYRLPTATEWNDEYKSWSSESVLGAFFSPLQLPVAGGRLNSGMPTTADTFGIYWSSTVGGTNASHLYIFGFGVFINGNSRAHAYSIRCIKN